MIKILFICHGNICRSTMAEFVLKDLVNKKGVSDKFIIDSAGTSTEEIGNDTHYGTKKKLDEMNISYTTRHARQVNINDYTEYDYLICMDDRNIINLKRIVGEDESNKIKLLLDYVGKHQSIKDPWYTNNFDETYNDILEGCNGLLESINI